MHRCAYVVRRQRKARLAAQTAPVDGVNAAFNGENGSAQCPLPELSELPRAGVSPQSLNMNPLESTFINRRQQHRENGQAIQSGTGSMESAGNGSIQSGTRTIMRANPAYSSVSSGVDTGSPSSNRPRPIYSSPSYDYPRIPQGAARSMQSMTSDGEGSETSGSYEN